MRQYQLTGSNGLDALTLVEAESRPIGEEEVRVRMTDWSLNYRDLSMPHGGYVRNDKPKTDPPMVPLSDGAGIVLEVGAKVDRFREGDEVAGCFFQEWIDGDLTEEQIGSALGGAIDGVLAEECVFPQHGLVKRPDSLDLTQTATLPCAAVTAWQALTLGNCGPVQTVLLLGTGGVSIFALQFAKAMGAKVIITSSSDDKLERAKSMGADETINYRTTPDWEQAVRELTNGVGVDHVVEVGGAGTFEKSLASTRVSGHVSLIGVLSGNPEQNPSPMPILFNRLTVQGIYVGSRAMFEAMNAFIDEHQIQPVIDNVFHFDQARDAYEALQAGNHFGKITLTAMHM